MTLKKWTTGDTITERSANNKSIRKGTTTDRDAIVTADLEIGDHFYNETENCVQVLHNKSPDKWQSLRNYLAADATEVTVLGTTATQKKDTSFAKSTLSGYPGNHLFIIAELKTTNAGSTASFRTRLDGGGSDKLVLTTTSTSFEIVVGSFDIKTETDDARHTLEFFMDDGAGDTITNRELEVWGV